MEHNKKHPSNPNFEARELIAPMIFEKDDGTPLTEPMVFYDRVLDLNYPLPEVTPLGIEYHTNWKMIEKESNVPIFPNDYLTNLKIQQQKQSENQVSTLCETKPPLTKFHKRNCRKKRLLNEELATTPYHIMNKLLKAEKIIIVNETFYVYSGTSYEPKSHKDITRLIMEHCRNDLEDKSSAFINGVANFLMMEPKLLVSQSNLPQKYVAFQNGVVDISTNMFYNHSSEFLTLYEIRANYYSSDSIQTPIFDKYMYTVTGGDELLTERILQSIGYLLTPDKNGKCFFLLQGVPHSGKSVLANLIQKLFSYDAVVQLEAQLFGDKFTASEIIGKALCSFPDIPASPLNDATVSRLKLYTGNDPISAPIRYKENEKFICDCKFLFATNHAFLTQNEDQAFNNRIIAIPFKYAISKDEENYDLERLLFNERDGIVSKAMSAYYRLVSNKYVFAGDFQPNDVIAENTSDSVDFRIHLYEFIKKYYVKDKNGVVYTDDAYRIFGNIVSGISINDFSRYFQQYSCKIFDARKGRKRKGSSSNPISCLLGINIKSEVDNDIS